MRKLFIAPAILSAASAAHAQDAGANPAPDADQVRATADALEKKQELKPWRESEVDRKIFDGDYAIVGVGVASMPRYEGSRYGKITPAAGAIGSVGGIGFRIKGPSLVVDFMQDPKGAKVGVSLGPNIRYAGARTGKVKDPVVARLPKVKGTIEAGVSAGLNLKRVLTKQDSLSIGLAARWDISGKGGGRIVSPSVSYLLPVHKAQVVGLSASADFVDRKYARYRYSVTPAGSLVSGLPAYSGKGGLKETTFGLFTARDLSGNFLDGGFAVGAGFLYSRLHGAAAETPITRLRGSRNQWMFGAGLAYAF